MSDKLTYVSVLAEADRIGDEYSTKALTVAEHLLSLAKGAKDVKAFLEGCKAAEAERTKVLSVQADEHNIKGMERRTFLSKPRSWTQAQSDIKRAWEAGHMPKVYKNFTALKLAKLKTGEKAAGKRGPKIALGDDALTEKLKALVLRIMALEPKAQAEILGEIEDVVAEYEAKHEKPAKVAKVAEEATVIAHAA